MEGAAPCELRGEGLRLSVERLWSADAVPPERVSGAGDEGASLAQRDGDLEPVLTRAAPRRLATPRQFLLRRPGAPRERGQRGRQADRVLTRRQRHLQGVCVLHDDALHRQVETRRQEFRISVEVVEDLVQTGTEMGLVRHALVDERAPRTTKES